VRAEKMGRFYCLEARRDSSAHSNSVRTLGMTLSGDGGTIAPACPGVGGGGGIGGGPVGIASSRHLTIFPGLVRKYRRVRGDGEMTETRSYPSATKSSIETSVACHSSTLVGATGGATGVVCDKPRSVGTNTEPAARTSRACNRIGAAIISSMGIPKCKSKQYRCYKCRNRRHWHKAARGEILLRHRW
jgi:hypothetical protein